MCHAYVSHGNSITSSHASLPPVGQWLLPLFFFFLAIMYSLVLQKEIATHSSIFAWRIPWTEEPGELQSMGSQRVRHN